MPNILCLWSKKLTTFSFLIPERSVIRVTWERENSKPNLVTEFNAKKQWIINGDTEETERGGDPGIKPWVRVASHD